MKKIMPLIVALLAGLMVVLSSCESKTLNNTILKEGDHSFSVITIDDCEYIIGYVNNNSYGGIAIVHKQNCKYCEARKVNGTTDFLRGYGDWFSYKLDSLKRLQIAHD